MIIKVGDVTSVREAGFLARADVLSVRVGPSDHPRGRVVSPEYAEQVRAATSARVALAVDPLDLDRELVRRLAPDLLEFEPARDSPATSLEDQLATLEPCGLPLLASGLHILADDLHLLDEEALFVRLRDAGAEYFQIDIESLVDPGYLIDPESRERVAWLLARYPVLTRDTTQDAPPTGFGEAGIAVLLSDVVLSDVELGDERGGRVTEAARLLRALRPE